MEKTEACAILGVPIEASRSEVETAFQKRMREVRARSAAARGASLRAQCQREVVVLRDAQDRLLRELGESLQKQPTIYAPPVDEPQLREPSVDDPKFDERPTEALKAGEQPAASVDEEGARKSPCPTDNILGPLGLGQLFLSRFELQRELEIGSTGALWLAQDHATQHQVALLFLPDLISSDKAAVEDLRNEIRRMAALNHSNILHIFDLVEDRGRVAIEIEYSAGRSFSELRFGRPTQVFEVGDLKTWVKELCEALQYAHEVVGLIHGNVQPGNLIVDRAGSLKVKDFGISNCINELISRLVGIPGASEALQYKSPQQAAGAKASIADDLYSLGATLYESLTSRPPFYAGDVGVQVSANIPPSMTERRAELGIEGEHIPKNWDETVTACLAKDPAQRPRSAMEIAKRLENATPQSNIPPSPPAKSVTDSIPKPQPPVLPPPTREPWLAIVGIIFILGFISAVFLFSFHYPTELKLSKLVKKPSPTPAVSPSPSEPTGSLSVPTPSPGVSSTPFPPETATPIQSQSSSPSPPTLSQQEIEATKKDVINRIKALPGVTADVKAKLIGNMDRARSMERLTIIPFDIGQSVLRRAATDEVVKTFDKPEMRKKLSDLTIILVVAGYADTGGRPDLNLRISQERADYVSRILKEQAKLLNAMQTIGMGGTELLDGKRPDQNRAVEVWAVVPL
jgi:serine/threonine protein kinase